MLREILWPVFGRAASPVVEENDLRLRAEHVVMDDNDFQPAGGEITGLPKDGENFLVILRDFLRAREQAWRKWKARQ